MPIRRTALLAALTLLTSAYAAHAVCTANEIIRNERDCSVATCTIAKDYVVTNGCTLDFGNRIVTLARAGKLTIPSGTVTVKARRLTIQGLIDGRGTGVAARGAMVILQTTENFEIPQGGEIDVSGNASGGDIIARAGGAVSIVGDVRADFLNQEAGGGLIDITAAGALSSDSRSTISARGGNDSDGGGEIDLTAGGAMTLSGNPDVSGLDGGFMTLQAGSTLSMQGALASGGGDAGSGGCIEVIAGSGANVAGNIIANGASGTFMTGGCGGLICVDGGSGNATVAATGSVTADGAAPDGGGGIIFVLARGNSMVNGSINARGPTGETCGGCIDIDAGYDIAVASTGMLVGTGGDSGGAVGLTAARNLVIQGNINVAGGAAGSLGGDVSARAGRKVSGSLTLNGTIDVTSRAACSAQNGCGEAGSIELSGCNVTVAPTGALLATAPSGGQTSLTARNTLTVSGKIDASTTIPTGTRGDNQFTVPIGHPPVVQGPVRPAADRSTLTICPVEGNTVPRCLNPCPVCGNGVTEFPETCDRGAIPPRSCGGCSIYCQTENCNDGLVCTGDSCNPVYGCLSKRTPGCTEPTATRTGTPPTTTPSRTRTATPSATRAPPTATASAIPTTTPTPISTGTPAATSTVISTSTPAATTTATATAPACPGDCSGDGSVLVNEIVAGVNIALGNAAADTCPAFDRNGDGMVLINELVAAVNAALGGC